MPRAAYGCAAYPLGLQKLGAPVSPKRLADVHSASLRFFVVSRSGRPRSGTHSDPSDSKPERGAFMRIPITNCDIKSVDLAYNRLHNAIRTARMCRVRKEMGMAKLVFGMNQSL